MDHTYLFGPRKPNAQEAAISQERLEEIRLITKRTTKLRLLRDDIGNCICKDCSHYISQDKRCAKGRASAGSPDSCENFHRSYEAGGNGMNG